MIAKTLKTAIEIQESKFTNIKFFDIDLIWARWPN